MGLLGGSLNVELRLIRENIKSLVYENEKYVIKEKDVSGGFYVRNGDKKNPYYNVDLDEDEYIWMGNTIILEVTNKITGKKCQKRCYQGHGAAQDFQDALDGKNNKFKDMIRKLE